MSGLPVRCGWLAATGCAAALVMSSTCLDAVRILKLGQRRVDLGKSCTRPSACPVHNLSACPDAAGCGCFALYRACGRCYTPIWTRLQHHIPDQSHRKCTLDRQCNSDATPNNICTSGRCQCHVAPDTGSWGGWNCSHANGLRMRMSSARVDDGLYAESRYHGYYRHLDRIGGQALEADWMAAGSSDSGHGSEANQTIGVRTALPHLLALLRVRTLIDCPAGDFHFMRAVLASSAAPPGLHYYGLDIVTALIERLQGTFGTRNRVASSRLAARPHHLRAADEPPLHGQQPLAEAWGKRPDRDPYYPDPAEAQGKRPQPMPTQPPPSAPRGLPLRQPPQQPPHVLPPHVSFLAFDISVDMLWPVDLVCALLRTAAARMGISAHGSSSTPAHRDRAEIVTSLVRDRRSSCVTYSSISMPNACNMSCNALKPLEAATCSPHPSPQPLGMT